MRPEIEVKFLNIDVAAIRARLSDLGAVNDQPMRLMRRAVIETHDLAKRDAFVRVRDEGDKTTLTYKQFHDHDAIGGATEIETTVGDFDAALAILGQLGITHKSYQESRRETWRLDEAEVVLDEWPGLDPYIEIEASTEQQVRGVAASLGFNWNDAVFGAVTSAYQIQYPNGQAHKLIEQPRITFDSPLPAVITGE